MIKNRQKIILFAKNFVEKCAKNNIWYVVDNGTLLGTIREKGMIAWDDDFDVMMTLDSFKKLQQLYPNNILTTDDKNYPLQIPKFVEDKSRFLQSDIFVDIFIVVPTTEKRIKQYRSFKNKMRFIFGAVHSTWEPYNFSTKLFKVISWMFKWIPKKITYQEGLAILKDENPTEFYTIDNPVDSHKINRHPNFNFKRELRPYEDFFVQVPTQYKWRLENKFGKNYMIPNENARKFEHKNVVSIIKRKSPND